MVSSGEECLDECNYIEYITDVSTIAMSDAYLKHFSVNASISFTVYYKTFDITKISYHGKVQYIIIFWSVIS